MKAHAALLYSAIFATGVLYQGDERRSLQSQSAAECLRGFHGVWRGSGRVVGRAVVMEQNWNPAMNGAFTEMRMRHLATDTSTVPSFEGRGFYRATGSRAPDSLGGTWLDARGYQMEVRGSCSGSAMSSHWTGAERGRTMYLRSGDAMEVIDSVYLPQGGAREFGRSQLRRD